MVSEENHFERGKILGEGAFGKVFLCHDKKEQDKKYAMKVIDLKDLLWDERNLAEKEANLLTNLKHKHILHAVTAFQEKETLCIVTELCDQGDLEQFLKARKGKSVEEHRIVEWLRQICSALEYLHGRSILHRDIKTQNIFLTGKEMIAKLGDLGLAKVLESSIQKALTFCGSPYYMSPEILGCKPYDSKSDIWAMGVCVYEMTTLKRPFNAHRMQQLIFEIVHGQIPPMPKDEYSPELIEIMERMICRNADNRPSATELLEDDVFKNPRPPKCRLSQTDALCMNNPTDSFSEKIRKGKCDIANPTECGQCFTSANDGDKTLRTAVIEENDAVYYNYLFPSPKYSAPSYSRTEFSKSTSSDSKSSMDSASDIEGKEYLKDTNKSCNVEPETDLQQLSKPRKFMEAVRDRVRLFLKLKGSDCDMDTRTSIPDSVKTKQETVLNQMKRKRKTRTNGFHSEDLWKESHNYVYFWEIDSVFSQWFPCTFVVDGITYNSAVQYMMHQKAVLMGDAMAAEIILALDEPQEIKQQGRCVQNFNQDLWYGARQEIVETGNVAKFSQNEDLKNHLFSTFPRILVEASPMDRIWGIGLSKDDKRAWNKETWRGQNLLGETLTRVRNKLMESFLEPVVTVKAD